MIMATAFSSPIVVVFSSPVVVVVSSRSGVIIIGVSSIIPVSVSIPIVTRSLPISISFLKQMASRIGVVRSTIAVVSRERRW